MSVFIKGMEMPKSCNKCFFRHITLTDNDYCLATREKIPWEHRKEKQDFCPLIEVPQHGDLIDREKTVNRITELSGKIANQLDYYASASYTLIALFLQNKHEFPTVIEAEDGE